MSKKQKAAELFSSNFNCSQAVFAAFAPELGIDEKLALKLGTPFGTGSKSGNICGAVSGALLVLGAKFGHDDGQNTALKTAAHNVAADYVKRFEASNGSLLCRELLGGDPMISEQRKLLKQSGAFKTICPKLVESAVVILEQVISDYE